MPMFKRIISFAMALFMLVCVLCACTDNTSGNGTTTAPSTETAPPTDPTNDPGSNGPSQPENPEDSEDSVIGSDPSDTKPYLAPAQALYGASSNGYGIWTATRGFTTAKRVCIDSMGYIVFEMDKSETDVAGVHNNAVLMKVNYDYYVLRSVPDGRLLFDSSNADGAKIILPAQNGKDMFRDGYIMVMKAVDSSKGVTYEIGFINGRGEWLQPLSGDNPILKHFDNSMTIAGLEKEVSYLGEGVIGMLCSNQVYRYYDIDSNSVAVATFPNNISKYTMYDALDYNVRFADGVSDPVYMNNNYYLFHTDGRIEQFNVLWPYGIPRAVMLGNPYFDRENKVAYFLYEYQNSILVADSKGNIVKKHDGLNLKEYHYLTADRIACRSFAEDGLARIILEDAEGVSYYVVLDTKGQFLFEPVRLNDNVNRVYDLEGHNIEVDATSGYGYFVVIDNDGTICYESEYVNDFSVKNGVLHYNDGNEDVYTNIQVPALY